ncbi:MAG: phosphatase PAP2 family protein [Candidatus Pacearchaeota archaeon]
MKSNKLIIFLLSIASIIILFIFSFQLDNSISKAIPSLWNPFLTGFFSIITYIGNTNTMITLGLILFVILVLRKEYRKGIISSVILIFSAGLGELIKFIIQRQRPLNSLIQRTDPSFPSLHALGSLIFFSLIIYLFKDKIKNKFLKILFIAVNIILILLIGLSRIYLNVHWFSDVIAGYVLGLIILFFSLRFFDKN